MSERADLDRVLGSWLRAEAPRKAPDDLLGPVFDVTSASRPLPTWRALLSVPPMRAHSAVLVGSPTLRLTRVVVVALVIGLLAVMGALLAGSRDTTLPAGSGLIVYESGGDIYVGDPATGDTEAIVTGPEFEGSPIFSPDGTRIAFTRGDAEAPEAILVVRPDGSDERIVALTDFSARGLRFSWTPDSASLVVQHDSLPLTFPHGDGELTLIDVTGVAPPRLLTPPLPRWVGGVHPQTWGEIAPMFRPPTGHRMLSYQEFTGTLVEMDIDGSNVSVLIDPAQTDLPFEIVDGAVWSPDGRWIAVTAGDLDSPVTPVTLFNERIYVVSADGSRVRRLTRAPSDVDPSRSTSEGGWYCSPWPAWSPDGSMILINRTTTGDLEQAVVVDVATGVEREITVPDTALRPGDPCPSMSWSPDGRSVLFSSGVPGTRPIVIDVETDRSTELPWESDSHPSWRLVSEQP